MTDVSPGTPGSFPGGLGAHRSLARSTGARVLPGGTQESPEEIAEGVPGQEVRLDLREAPEGEEKDLGGLARPPPQYLGPAQRPFLGHRRE